MSEHQDSSEGVARGEFVRLVFTLQIACCVVEVKVVEEIFLSCKYYGNLHCSQVYCLFLAYPPGCFSMLVTHARLVSYSADHVASAGITTLLLLDTSRCPVSFCPCGVLRFVLDGMAAEVSFELITTRFIIFLVGEPKAFPFVIRRHLPSVTRLLVASTGDEGESKFMMVQERDRRDKKVTLREGGDTDEGWRSREIKLQNSTKKHFRG
jgi:hypothetical protein